MPASSCSAGSPGIPAADVRFAMASSASEAEAAAGAGQIWDAPVEPLDVDQLATGTDAVFLAVPETLAAELAPGARRPGHARVRSVGRVPAARRGATAALVSAFAGDARSTWRTA